MSSKFKVTLVPWDPESCTHIERLVEQRVQCTWDHDKVEKLWKEQQLKGNKCIYWIAISHDEPEADEKTRRYIDTYLKEYEMLQDTAVTINGVARKISRMNFIPIGHISLDAQNPDAKTIGLDLPSERVFWIKSFYVARSLQGMGIGRATMDEVEAIAVREPLCAKTLMLDTVQKDDQKREQFAMIVYGGIPKVTNQEWYARRGYKLIKTVQNYYRVPDTTGKIWDTKTVFMRKDIS